MKKKPILRFIGQPGQHLTGIPARDLSAEEVSALSDQALSDCLASGLYQQEPVTPARKQPATPVKEGEE